MPRITELRNLIIKAKHAYYYSGEPIMSDAEYDALEDELRQLEPNDPVLGLVGSSVPLDTMLTKARHAMPMGSQSKVNSADEFRAWCVKNDVKAIHASLKGDGASAAAYYRDGRLVQAISRGDGTIGEDITANALRFKGLPAWVGNQGFGFTGSVRFEVILTVEDWTKIDPSRSKNPRNAGTGIMGRKNGMQSDYLTTFAFDLDETRDGLSVVFQTEAQKSARLAELGFNVITYQIYDSAEGAIGYFQQIAQTRDALPIWIDGVVMKVDDIAKQRELGVTAGRPKGQIAWKFDSSGAETVLEGVVVSGGHTGGLYPTAQLRPVDIGGTTVSNASLANFDEIERLDVAIGDSVWVVKANDIIPKIIRVTQRPSTRQPIPVPSACPFCGGEVGRRRTNGGNDGVIIECSNPECPKKSTGKINRWISSLDILGIGDVVLESMIERFDLADAADLYLLHTRAIELAGLVTNAEKDLRLGEKRTSSILNAIDATRALTLSRFLGSLGLDHLGKRRVELMIKAAGGALDTLDDWRSGKLRDPAIAILAGVPNIGAAIQDGIDAMGPVIDKLLINGVVVQDVSPGGNSAELAIPTQSVCISGKLPSGKKKANYEEALRKAGFALVDDVGKGLTYLVLADPTSSSSKSEKARKLNISIISEDELIDLCRSEIDDATASKPTPTSSLNNLPSTDVSSQNPPKELIMAKSSAAASIAPSESDQFRRFEYVDEKSSKFWEIRVSGSETEVSYGKIGTAGQAQTKSFDSPEAAQKSADKLVAEKIKGGYKQAGSTEVAAKPEPAIAQPLSSVRVKKPGTTQSLVQPAPLAPKLKSKIDAHLAAKSRILEFFGEHPELTESRDRVLTCLRFSEPSYQLLAEELKLSMLDRTKSLIGRHLFISEQHPHPLGSGGEPIYGPNMEIIGKTAAGTKLFPVLQLDMSWVNQMCSRDFEPCLLQFWLEAPYFISGIVRKIPLLDVESSRLLSIELDADMYREGCLQVGFEEPDKRLSASERNWVGVPSLSEQASHQILDCRPIGVTGPDIDDSILEMLKEDPHAATIPENIWNDLQLFGWEGLRPSALRSKHHSVLQLFGRFIMSSNDDPESFKGDGCLFSLDRGSRASSVITYLDKNKITGESIFYYNNK